MARGKVILFDTASVDSPGIYAIVNSVTGGFYIGSSKNMRQRISDHFYELARNRHGSRHLLAAYGKYGAGAFYGDIVEIVPGKSLLLEREQFWLVAGAYNMVRVAGRPPDATGRKLSTETRQRLSLIKRALTRTANQNEASGRNVQKMIASNRGRKHTEDARANMSLGRLGLPVAIRCREAWNKGKPTAQAVKIS